jgi:hypothetical protein
MSNISSKHANSDREFTAASNKFKVNSKRETVSFDRVHDDAFPELSHAHSHSWQW